MKPYKKTIGLTGGIATGKSTVSKILKDKGYRVIDSDKIAHDVMEKSGLAYIKVVEEFGNEILFENGDINRKKLSDIVFNNKDKLQTLNQITHPIIINEIKNKRNKILMEEDVVFLDIPLLIEQKENLNFYDIFFDKIVLVYINKENQLKRLINRDNIDEKTAIDIIKSQKDIDEKRDESDYIVNNMGSFLELEEEVDKMLKKLII